MLDFYSKNLEEVLKELNATTKGLSTKEAEERKEKYGKNALEEAKKKTLLQKIWAGINDPMILILVASALVSGAMGDVPEMFIILIVVTLNTVIGLIQESKAEEAVEALKKMSANYAKVLRDGELKSIDASEIVPGDVVLLDAGDLVPADLRLFESSSLKIEEASLTGESVASEKFANAKVEGKAPIGDRINMAYYGTGVTYGRARGIVCETGMKTEMGKIATIINESEENLTPLQQKLAELGKFLTVAVLGICVVIFATIILKEGEIHLDAVKSAFMVSVSLAVAAIPESLPAVVTIVMAIGVTIMAKKNAIIRKLPAVETLGCAQVICSDKTGTLTQNKMDVRELYCDEVSYTADEFAQGKNNELFYDILYLCNDSVINPDGKEIGDPTETCLKRFGLKKYKTDQFSGKTRIADLPFDSDRKMMSTVNQIGDKQLVFTKGAPDEILKRCTNILQKGQSVPITTAHKDRTMQENKRLADKALRVLGVAYKEYKEGSELEESLTFVGLVGLIDPPRPEAFDAIEKCKHAGIITVMITGDHKDTAVAIATELGIINNPSQAIFGAALDDWSDEQLQQKVQAIRVYARVSPQHKVRIVEAWKALGKVVAMTGDGVNDAPALKIADIGVGMGITGTDVSKGVSDMLLQDDNFATIVSAVEEGRKIYTNIRKSVQFLLSSNLSEVLSLFLATLILPAGTIFLSAVHILWINLVTDSLPAIGLGLNRTDDGVMDDPPRDASKSIFSNGVGISVIYQGIIITALTVSAYFFGAIRGPEVGTTLAFFVLSTTQILHSFNIKAGLLSVFSLKTFDNKTMNLGALIPMMLTLFIINFEPLANVFDVVPLTRNEWMMGIYLSFGIIIVEEIAKIFKRGMKKASSK